METVERYRPDSDSAPQNLIFGSPPLCKDDDQEAYNELLKRLIDLIKPTDIIEEILARDYVDLTWERLRWRRGKAKLLPDIFSSDRTFGKYDWESKFPLKFEIVERADHLIALAERRCQAILRELEYYRCESQILSNRTLQIENDTNLKAGCEGLRDDEQKQGQS